MAMMQAEIRATGPAVQDVQIKALGAVLSGRLYLPDGPPKVAVVLHGAAGVPMRFYRGFAEWLSGQGFACLLYDYRDFGQSGHGSQHKPLRQSRATLADWGTRDQPAALARLCQLVPKVPVWVIGHSLGGAMLGFHGPMNRVERIITVGSGMTHLSDHPWPYRGLAALFWYGHAPVVTALLGWLPGRQIGFGSDLPAGVYWQWRRWCTRAGFYLSDVGRTLPLPNPTTVTAPMTMIAISDDQLVPPAAVWRLMATYPMAFKKQRVLRPADFGLRKIGHLGVFARANAAVWPAIVA